MVGSAAASRANSGRPSARSTSPQELTTATAATRAGPAGISAQPRPPGSRRLRHFPVEAPVPAPTRPRANGSPDRAARTARRPPSASGGPDGPGAGAGAGAGAEASAAMDGDAVSADQPATDSSKIDIPTTMGTGPSGVPN